MAYSMVIQNKVRALNTDSLNASAVSGSNLENGNVVILNHLSGSSGYTEVFYVTTPVAGSLNNCWMVYTPEIVVVQAPDGTNYKGINQDPRNFINFAGSIVDIFHPEIGDIITLNADAFSGAISTNTHANSRDGYPDLAWGTAQVASSLTLKWLATEYISIGSGSAIGGGARVPAYKMLVIAN